MLPSGSEIIRSTKGAWLIFLGKREGIGYFDISDAGFWRSFTVFFLLLPLFYITWMAGWKMAIEGENSIPEGLSRGTYYLMIGISDVLDWVVYPIVVALLSKLLGISRQFTAFIIVRNWATIIIFVPIALLYLIYVAGIAGPETIGLFMLVLFAVAIRYAFVITRMMLQVGWQLASGLVVLDVLISIAIGIVFERMLGL